MTTRQDAPCAATATPIDVCLSIFQKRARHVTFLPSWDWTHNLHRTFQKCQKSFLQGPIGAKRDPAIDERGGALVELIIRLLPPPT